MVANAAAAITIAKELGLSKEQIHKLLETFHNAKTSFCRNKNR